MIVTAPFIREFGDWAWLDRTAARLADLDVRTPYVWVYCNAETMHLYLRHRGAARDAAKLADWPGYVASINVDFRPSVPHVLIENSTSSTLLQTQRRDLLASVLGEGD